VNGERGDESVEAATLHSDILSASTTEYPFNGRSAVSAARKRKRVAIVGGGCAAMAAAWDLTSPMNPDRCDVTIFQMGGRLGGKGASSRNGQPGYRNRIEEHGLHLWLGYYENAFRMVRTCFEELREARARAARTGKAMPPELHAHLDREPFDNWNWLSAFERANLVGLADNSTGDWVPWIARFPEYVPTSEEGATGFYYLPDGTLRPGVHVVSDASRAYPGDEPPLATGHTASDRDAGLERPNVAFFLTHALRALQAFMDSLELRTLDLGARGKETLEPDELMRNAMVGTGQARADTASRPDDVLSVLRKIRLAFLIPAITALANAARIIEGPLPHQHSAAVTMLDRFIDVMRERIEIFVQRDTAARRTWELIDLLAANIRGIAAAGLEGTDDFSSLDEWNYIDWLRKNRVAERTLNNPIIRGAHDLGFAYRDGNSSDPQIAAGQAISAGCRFFFMYKGALFWRMKAGMGDVVFAPMYLALRNRGVKFRFFHRLDEILVNNADQAVSGLKFLSQVSLKIKSRSVATNYEPLISVNGQPGWPRKPLDKQFDFDAAMREEYERMAAEDEQGVNFESIWCRWRHGKEVTVRVGKGGEYDAVVVTVPVAALGRVSQQVAASTSVGNEWKSMLQKLGTVATQSVQLWVNRRTRALGWPHGQVSFSAFVHPYDTWADLSHLIDVEGTDTGPHEAPALGVHYFCSVLPERHIPRALRVAQIEGLVQDLDAVADAHDIVRENARNFLDEWAFQLWPDAVHRYPTAFKWELLVDPARRNGADRIDGQHIVANVDPSDRYTLSLPGTTRYRLRPDKPVLRGMFVAGDWTDSGLNIGCVEAAVMSGRLASAGITSYPKHEAIPGLCSRKDHVTQMQGGY
jgi:uncharacterized protein with NAD-binding domain and iron-sulfur cluster